jgi:hypothetical protein
LPAEVPLKLYFDGKIEHFWLRQNSADVIFLRTNIFGSFRRTLAAGHNSPTRRSVECAPSTRGKPCLDLILVPVMPEPLRGTVARCPNKNKQLLD